jgi:tetrahydromethanopterin S-methyltransferase subunit G
MAKVELHTDLSLEEAQERLQKVLDKKKNFWSDLFRRSNDSEVIGKAKGRNIKLSYGGYPRGTMREALSPVFYGDLTEDSVGSGTKVNGSFKLSPSLRITLIASWVGFMMGWY